MESHEPDPQGQPSLAFRCPKCRNENPQEEGEVNPGPDRWFVCPQCGYRWSVSPIADS
jgi:ssDNA-binding Zn-finger/Zn-ribbon topoisomerase 1